MNIYGVRIYRQFQPFVEGPYVCRGHSEDGFDSAIVALHSSEGTVGWGEAAPLGAFYAEGFSESIIAGLMVLAPKLLSCPADAPAQVKATLDDAMFGQHAVKSALDMAAWDLFARIAAQPLANILGGRTSTSAPLYRSISQAAPDVMANQARGFVDAGYRRLQVKVGGESKEDVERLVAVRACVPPDVILYANANGAWFLDEAMRFVDATRNQDNYLEQPCMSLGPVDLW